MLDKHMGKGHGPVLPDTDTRQAPPSPFHRTDPTPVIESGQEQAVRNESVLIGLTLEVRTEIWVRD
jgi:hypothetical protein